MISLGGRGIVFSSLISGMGVGNQSFPQHFSSTTRKAIGVILWLWVKTRSLFGGHW